MSKTVAELSEFYYDNGQPKKCPKCGGTDFCPSPNHPTYSEYMGMVEYMECCANCFEDLAYWAYGRYESDMTYAQMEAENSEKNFTDCLYMKNGKFTVNCCCERDCPEARSTQP